MSTTKSKKGISLAKAIALVEAKGLDWSIHNYRKGGGYGAFVHRDNECFSNPPLGARPKPKDPAEALMLAFEAATLPDIGETFESDPIP